MAYKPLLLGMGVVFSVLNKLKAPPSAMCCTDRPHPQYGRDFPEEIPEKFRKDPGNALRAFPGIPLESTAGIPQTLQFKAFEGSRAFPEVSPPQHGWGTLLLERASQSRSWNSQQYWGDGRVLIRSWC